MKASGITSPDPCDLKGCEWLHRRQRPGKTALPQPPASALHLLSEFHSGLETRDMARLGRMGTDGSPRGDTLTADLSGIHKPLLPPCRLFTRPPAEKNPWDSFWSICCSGKWAHVGRRKGDMPVRPHHTPLAWPRCPDFVRLLPGPSCQE